ncbi:DUF6641 family protein [Pacificibacter marinus]|uniref:Uncharacterized protein n=1 Tax=Pacificibacter marinus TaxID=658057 RepID=A0A1Y5RHV8_9RHOB|nr:DUF6641 family protein [Pacificibacter marinus]SEK18967.1 hypothetical protein SAMN04488032_101193 [Pacificibacter marinus]SLN17511.1 hypothetical protein PAM7971_00457 [Pacificibacter marinus]
MSILAQLDVSNRIISARQRRKPDTVEYRRKKLIANIEEQIELATLALAQKPMELKRKRGHSIVAVKPRIWWKTTSDGSVFTMIRFNREALVIDMRGTSIEVSALEHLPEIYRTVIKAVQAGELDRAIENVVNAKRD